MTCDQYFIWCRSINGLWCKGNASQREHHAIHQSDMMICSKNTIMKIDNTKQKLIISCCEIGRCMNTWHHRMYQLTFCMSGSQKRWNWKKEMASWTRKTFGMIEIWCQISKPKGECWQNTRGMMIVLPRIISTRPERSPCWMVIDLKR